jgi:hypothetical protein
MANGARPRHERASSHPLVAHRPECSTHWTNKLAAVVKLQPPKCRATRSQASSCIQQGVALHLRGASCSGRSSDRQSSAECAGDASHVLPQMHAAKRSPGLCLPKSNTVTVKPRWESTCAQCRPLMPPPTTAMALVPAGAVVAAMLLIPSTDIHVAGCGS